MAPTPRVTAIRDIQIELIDCGAGRPLLFLHPAIGIEANAPVLERLAARSRVLAPTHPGFGRSEAPKSFDTVDDLAYFYLDLLDALDLRDVAWSAYRSAAGSPPRSRSSRLRGSPISCSPIRSASRSAAASIATSSISSPSPRSEFLRARLSRSRARQARLQVACRMPRWKPCRATARRRRVTPGRLTCMTRSSGAVCTASAFRRCSCGA